MSISGWSECVERLGNLLGRLSCRDGNSVEIGSDEGFLRWKEITLKLRDTRGTIFLIGNGASAAMSSHMAADLAKNGGVHTEVFTDLSLITTISNDLGYEYVFSEPLSRRANTGDMLVAISSSGRSRNIMRAAKTAKNLKMIVVTLSAMDKDNPLRTEGRLNLYVPAKTYGEAETCHAAILHHWMDMIAAPTDENN